MSWHVGGLVMDFCLQVCKNQPFWLVGYQLLQSSIITSSPAAVADMSTISIEGGTWWRTAVAAEKATSDGQAAIVGRGLLWFVAHSISIVRIYVAPFQ